MTQDIEVTKADRDKLRQWQRNYGRKGTSQDLLLAFASHRIAAEQASAATITELRARVEVLTEEVEERDEWLQIVDTLPLDEFDRLGDYWIQRLCIVKMVNAIASVFVNHANENIMSRFREGQRNMMHLAFVEGCIAGARNELARATLESRSDG